MLVYTNTGHWSKNGPNYSTFKKIIKNAGQLELCLKNLSFNELEALYHSAHKLFDIGLQAELDIQRLEFYQYNPHLYYYPLARYNKISLTIGSGSGSVTLSVIHSRVSPTPCFQLNFFASIIAKKYV